MRDADAPIRQRPALSNLAHRLGRGPEQCAANLRAHAYHRVGDGTQAVNSAEQ